MKNLFKTTKEEILKRAKEANACLEEYKKAYKAENFKELLNVVTDNFNFCCNNKVIDVKLLESIGYEICKESNLYYNTSINSGFLLADSATVEASGSATVSAYGSAYVIAYDSTTVRAYDSATVRASGSATVEAYGSAYVIAYDSTTVRAYDSATVSASGSATVEASGSAYINSFNNIDHKISDRAILRCFYENRIVLADNCNK